jgi:hypothetical protein
LAQSITTLIVRNTVRTLEIIKKHFGKDLERDLNQTIAAFSIALAKNAYMEHKISTFGYLIDAYISDKVYTQKFLSYRIKFRINK